MKPQKLGATVVVENRAGRSASIGTPKHVALLKKAGFEAQ